MKRRIIIAFSVLLGLTAAYFIFQEFKGALYTWYADTHISRSTDYPASEQPDQVCLTWSNDPRTTQTIQWRNAVSVRDGWVEYREGDALDGEPTALEAALSLVEDKMLDNDPVNHRFTARLEGLKPATRYAYRVGSREKGAWTGWMNFKTAPQTPEPFSFLYMGDPQVGLEFWGKLLRGAYQRHPGIAFHVVTGDLVNRGNYRNEWDLFFEGARGVYDHTPIAPTPGNHDYAKSSTPAMYLDLFALPENGSDKVPKELSYSFEYSNALYISLDSNLSVRDQVPWLEEQLATSQATWKFVFYHHPAYSPKANRDNADIRRYWMPLFDKYGVDMALQGHDHAYMRSYPVKNDTVVTAPERGTVYVVTVSGTKFYELEPRENAEVAFADTSTYQIIDFTTGPDQLRYRAFNNDGDILDEITITK